MPSSGQAGFTCDNQIVYWSEVNVVNKQMCCDGNWSSKFGVETKENGKNVGQNLFRQPKIGLNCFC